MHGLGGSAGVGILLVASVADRVNAVAGLLLFAGATALSMAVVSAVGWLRPGPGPCGARASSAWCRRSARPSLIFGVWYALNAIQ